MNGRLIDQLLGLLAKYGRVEGCDPFDAFRDVLTDMRHIADQQGFDYGERDSCAHQVYLEENTEGFMP